MKPKITVIIPTYNAESKLPNTINSIIQQDIGFKNLEIILVDDCSTDNTQNIIKSYVKEYENIKGFYLEKNTGAPGRPRNIGIQNASANYIMFSDNDDTYSKDYCKKMFEVITKYNVDFVSSRYNLITDNGIKLNNSFLDNYDCQCIKLTSINEFPEIIFTNANLTIWTKIFKKDFILSNNIFFYEGTFYEDSYFCSNLFLKSNKFIILTHYSGYNYMFNESNDNYTFSPKKKYLNDCFIFLNDFESIYQANNYNFSFNNAIAEYLVLWTRFFLRNNFSKSDQIKLLKKMNPYYKKYSVKTRLINNIPLYFNIMINVFMKFFALSIRFELFIVQFYKKI